MPDPALSVRGLSKAFGAHRVLVNIDLDVLPGTIVGLLGPNGSGKSTLLDTVSGFVPKDAGTVALAGRDVTRLGPAALARAGLVRTFQLPRMPTRMSVREVVLAADRAGSGIVDALLGRRPASAARVDGLIERLLLSPVADAPASAISGGQKKLLSIAVALSCSPSVLCLDEPTAGVHPTLRNEIVALLRDANRAGTTLVIVEHDMAFIRGLCSRCVVLDRGELIADCAPDALAHDARVVEAYLGRAGRRVAAAASRAA